MELSVPASSKPMSSRKAFPENRCRNVAKKQRKSSSSSSSSEDDCVPLVSTDDEDSADEEYVYCNQSYRLDKKWRIMDSLYQISTVGTRTLFWCRKKGLGDFYL